MPNFIDCWSQLKAKGYKHADGSEVLNEHDKASMLNRISEHLKTGIEPLEAAKLSVQSYLDDAHGQLQSVYDQVRTKYPDSVDLSPISSEAFPSITESAESARRMALVEQERLEGGGPIEKEKTSGSGAEGQKEEVLSSPLASTAEPAAVSGTVSPPAAVALSVTSTEPHVSRIANRFVEERVKAGEIGEIAPGQGHSVMELRQRGLGMSPEEVNQHVSDVMSGTGDIVKQGEALTAEEARLSQRSNQLSREAMAEPTNTEKKLAADNAFKDLTDFHNGPVATLKTRWADAGKTLQGEIPVDLSTFNGMREAWLKDTGKPPPPEVEPVLRETAKKLSDANGEADASIAKVGDSIEQATKGRKLASYEQVRNNILQRLKERTPCN